MRSTLTVRTATITGSRPGRPGEVLTREAPWHGRSGGPLIDPDKGYLLGTVIGYESTPAAARREIGPGIYTSHSAVLRFCGLASAPLPAPRVLESRSLSCPCPGGSCPCPGGTCPWSCPYGR
jgi:hypothetical protein